MKPYFIMLVGIPGSGKSKWAMEIQSEKTVVVNPDSIRKEMTKSPSDQSVNVEVWIQAKKNTIKHLEAGRNVILDATNVNAQEWQDFIEGLPECQMVAKLFDVDPEVAYSRIEKDIINGVERSNVPEYAVYRNYGMYLYTRKVICEFFTYVTDVKDWIQDVKESKKKFGGHWSLGGIKDKIKKLKKEVMTSLSCLYLEVDESIANDIKNKVTELIEAYEKELKI